MTSQEQTFIYKSNYIHVAILAKHKDIKDVSIMSNSKMIFS